MNRAWGGVRETLVVITDYLPQVQSLKSAIGYVRIAEQYLTKENPATGQRTPYVIVHYYSVHTNFGFLGMRIAQ